MAPNNVASFAEGSGLRKQIAALRADHEQLVGELKQALSDLTVKVNTINEVINAIVEEVGDEQVRTTLDAHRARRRAEFEAKQSKTLEALKEKAIMVSEEAVTDTSTLVTKETYADGKVLTEQYVMAKVPPSDAKAAMVGKKIGETFEFQGVKIEVVGIYRFDKARADAVLKEEQEKAAEAQRSAALAEEAKKSQPTPLPVAAVPAAVEASAEVEE